MALLASTLLGISGNPRYQDFTASGTFTPSAALLARGGIVTVFAVGGGGAGGATSSANADRKSVV